MDSTAFNRYTETLGAAYVRPLGSLPQKDNFAWLMWGTRLVIVGQKRMRSDGCWQQSQLSS